MIKQISIAEGVELMLKGVEVPCLVPSVANPTSFADYMPSYLDKELKNFICLANVPDEPSPEPEEKPVKRAKGRKGALTRIEVDMGKVHALLDAGWSIEKVADEMQVSIGTIYARLKEEREEMEKKNEVEN